MNNRIIFILSVLGSVLLYLLINTDFLIALFYTDFMPGWDGQAHLSIGKSYADSIFPSTWGWINNWYLGMPFPQFYPPAIYFIVAFLSKIFFWIDYDLVFRLFILLISVAVPVFLILLSKVVIKNNLAAPIVGLLSVLILSYRGLSSNLGINLSSNITTGLYAQTLAYLFFILWIIFNNHFEKEKRYPVFSSIFFSLILLSNVHVIFPASIFFCCFFIFDYLKSKDRLLILYRYFIHGILSISITMFWVLPMLSNYDYVITKPLSIPPQIIADIVLNFFYMPIFIIASIYVSKRKGDYDILKLSISCLVSFAIILLLSIFDDLPLPLHFVRWFPVVIYTSVVPVVYLIKTLIEKSRYKVFSIVAISIFIFLINYVPIQYDRGYYPGIIYDRTLYEDFIGMLEYVDKDDVFLTEASFINEKPETFMIDSMLGQMGYSSIFSNIRESSISGLYLVPIRNLFSGNKEMWGIQSFLGNNKSFQEDTPVEDKIEMAKYFGVTKLILFTDYIAEDLDELGYKIEYKSDSFNLYSIQDKTSDTAVIEGGLVGYVGELGFKDRGYDNVTFSRLSEIWLENFNDGIFFVRERDGGIGNLMQFTEALVLNGKSDLDFEELETYLSKGKYVFYNNKYLNIEEISIEYSDYLVPYDIDNIHDLYLNISEVVKDGEIMNINGLEKSIDGISLDINSTNTRNYLVKRSYFPTWQDISGGDIYLVSPSFILVRTNLDIKLTFENDNSLILGYAISIFTVILVILFSIIKKCYNLFYGNKKH